MTPALWSVHHGDCLPWLASLPDKSADVVITDPPYSKEVHGRGSMVKPATTRKLAKIAGNLDGSARVTDFGFDAITAEQMTGCAEQFARLARRWVLVFSDIESTGDWRRALEGAGLDYVRTGVWVKLGAAPQFTGDRPANAVECVTIAHAPGRKRWGGGGGCATWTHLIERGAGGRGDDGKRLHTTPKPLPLMLELVRLFSEPGELVLDPFGGSFTTGVASLRLGRRFAGAELQEKYATTGRARLAAEAAGSTLHAARAGQLTLGGAA